MKSVRCVDCGRHNRLPEGNLVEARCGRCDSALTYWTWVAAGYRSQAFRRGVQVVGAVAVLSALFASDVLEWLETEPFQLNEESPASPSVEPIGKDSLASEF